MNQKPVKESSKNEGKHKSTLQDRIRGRCRGAVEVQRLCNQEFVSTAFRFEGSRGTLEIDEAVGKRRACHHRRRPCCYEDLGASRGFPLPLES